MSHEWSQATNLPAPMKLRKIFQNYLLTGYVLFLILSHSNFTLILATKPLTTKKHIARYNTDDICDFSGKGHNPEFFFVLLQWGTGFS